VDHFKQLNDNYGHPLGDDILKEVVLCLREEVREKDFLARFGGEEFCVVLPDTGEATASAIAERLRQTIVRAPLCGHEVTASFGVATLAPGMTDFEQLISQADMALYAAKNRGRNLVMSYSEAYESGLLVMHEERRR
jgi:diguanylate cyclase (GGDEF)-like protein